MPSVATPPARCSSRRAVPRSARHARSSAAVSPGRIGASTRAWTGPVSRPSSSAIRQTPVLSSPARMARSTGAAPRQRGRSEKCRFTIGTCRSTSARMSVPKAKTTPSSTFASRTSATRLETGSPSSSAHCFTGVGASALPRPRRRSGAVTTSATSWPASCRARKKPTATSGVPRKASLVTGRDQKAPGQASRLASAEPENARARRTRMACLRWSLSRRSRSKMPSRWSSSCWKTRPSSSSASIESSFP